MTKNLVTKNASGFLSIAFAISPLLSACDNKDSDPVALATLQKENGTSVLPTLQKETVSNPTIEQLVTNEDSHPPILVIPQKENGTSILVTPQKNTACNPTIEQRVKKIVARQLSKIVAKQISVQRDRRPPARPRVKKIVAEQLGLDANFVDDFGADSLDTIELVMALEEEFEIVIPDDEAEKIQTVGDAVSYMCLNEFRFSSKQSVPIEDIWQYRPE